MTRARLPIARDSLPVRPNSSNPGPSRPLILVIEDELLVIESLVSLLSLKGYRVECAQNGRLGVELAAHRPFDAAIVDLRLPDISGLDVLREWRRIGLRIPTVILTGFPDVDSAMEAARLGVASYVTKSPDFSKLLTAVRQAVEETALSQRRVQLFASRTAGRYRTMFALLDILEGMWVSHGRPDAAAELVARTLVSSQLTFCQFTSLAQALQLLLSCTSMRPRSEALAAIKEVIGSACAHDSQLMHPHVERVLDRLETADADWREVSDEDLAAESGVARVTLWRSLDKQLGLDFTACRRAVVMRRVVLQLAASAEHVRQIAFRVGYQHPSNLDRDFEHCFGCTPTQFRSLLRA
jgi:YesN/AraC family two-component response regulator